MLKLLLTFSAILLCSAQVHARDGVLVEAESFRDQGGWVLDTQFIDTMGSPYLMAHGLGVPVKDATTTVKFPSAGTYHVFVRTMDWVARWKAPGSPGQFQVVVDGRALSKTFGTSGVDWDWSPGGTVEIRSAETTVALHDLTGFNGRCDAIYFTKDQNAVPPGAPDKLAKWRHAAMGWPDEPELAGEFDLVVVGGGYGGLGAAIAAARMGCSVALIQNRPVLGGNGSSEVRVWAMGGIRRGLYPNLGEIVEEFADRAKESPGKPEEFGDEAKEALVRAEKNISLFLNHHVTAVEMAQGKRIASVTALDTRSGRSRRFAGKLFADTTGHGTLGALAGADLSIKETGHLGMSNMWRWADTGQAQSFPETPWALPLGLPDFPYPQRFHAQWFWESGFDKHPIDELESTRDWNLRAVFGAWNAMKNGEGAAKHPNARLEWVAYVGGTRESRQLLGDVILTRDDIVAKRAFPDGTVPTTWDIDLHYPKEQYARKFPEDPFISRAVFDKNVDKKHGYPVPYRCFYSRNIENLFMAGRCISVTHEALGTVRVMKTGGMIGEVVGKAASICVKNGCSPRVVYERYFEELKQLLGLHGVARRDRVTDEIRIPSGVRPLPPPVNDPEDQAPAPGLSPKELGGIVVDDTEAKLTGSWNRSGAGGLRGYVGSGYAYRSAKEPGTARYSATIPSSGRYEVRLSYGVHENRATNVPVAIECAEGRKAITVNQRVSAPLPHGFISLGTFPFTKGEASVTVGEGTVDGYVHLDAVQFLPAP